MISSGFVEDVADMQRVGVVFNAVPIFVIKSQGAFDGAKGELIPRYFRFGEQSRFQAFFAGKKIQMQQSGAKYQIDLIDVRQTDHAVKVQYIDARAGFFQSFAGGTFGRGFAVFHEPGRQRPQTVSGFDGAAAKQNFVFPFRDATNDHFRVLVMHHAAIGTDVTRAVVADGNFDAYSGAAVRAKIHIRCELKCGVDADCNLDEVCSNDEAKQNMTYDPWLTDINRALQQARNPMQVREIIERIEDQYDAFAGPGEELIEQLLQIARRRLAEMLAELST